MRIPTETNNPEIAGLCEKVSAVLKGVALPSIEPSSPTEAIVGFLRELLTTGYVSLKHTENLGSLWANCWSEKIFDIKGTAGFVSSESTEIPVPMEAMLSPERRAILERTRAIRREIGPVPWRVADLLREMGGENV